MVARCYLWSALLVTAAWCPGQALLRVGPNRPFQTIQAALAAAAPRDRIVVDAGTYTEAPVVTKGVTVLAADGGQRISVRGPFTFRDIPVGQQASLAGARFESAIQIDEKWAQVTTIVIDGCAGAVALHDCEFAWRSVWDATCEDRKKTVPYVLVNNSNALLDHCTFGTSYGGAAVEANGARLTLVSCTGLVAEPPFHSCQGVGASGRETMLVRDSHVTLNNTSIKGCDNRWLPPSYVHPAIVGSGSLILAGWATVQGGSWLTGWSSPLDGAPGITWTTGSIVTYRVQIVGGTGISGGKTGLPVLGPEPLQLPVPDLVGPAAAVPRGGLLEYRARGQAGDWCVWLFCVDLAPTTVPGIHGLFAGQPLVVLGEPFPSSQYAFESIQVPADDSLLGASLYVQVGELAASSLCLSAIAVTAIR